MKGSIVDCPQYLKDLGNIQNVPRTFFFQSWNNLPKETTPSSVVWVELYCCFVPPSGGGWSGVVLTISGSSASHYNLIGSFSLTSPRDCVWSLSSEAETD